MPYDDITKMRAELLERYGPNERPEEFDDGASSLGQNPYMQEVGIFNKPPKFNPSRRTMGLDLPSVKNPIPTAIEDPTTALVPVQPQQPKTTSPLEALANMPMTRRKALEIPMNAAISNMGRGLIGEAVAPVVKSAVKTIVPEIPEEKVFELASTYISGILDKAIDLEGDNGYSGLSIPESNSYGLLNSVSLKQLSEQTKVPVDTLKKYLSNEDLKSAVDNVAYQHDEYLLEASGDGEGGGLNVGVFVDDIFDKLLEEKYNGVYPTDPIEQRGFEQEFYAAYQKELADMATGWTGTSRSVDKLTEYSLQRNEAVLELIREIIDANSEDLQTQVHDEIERRFPSRKRGKRKK